MAQHQQEAAATDELRQEPLTEELLERLLASTTPEAYLSQTTTDDRTLAEYLTDLIHEKGIKRADVVRGSEINATFVYQVFKGTRMAGRDSAIRLAFGTRCDLREAQRLLRHAGVSELWCKNRRDAVIIHCIANGLTLLQCDEELYRMGEQTLVPREG